MNVVRMMRNYGLNLGEADMKAVVRHLADTRGLSVEETEGHRYILEQEPNADDVGPDRLMTETCGRCYSYAHVALQRRTPEDAACEDRGTDARERFFVRRVTHCAVSAIGSSDPRRGLLPSAK